MKSIQTWLDEYGVSHQNPVNKTIHWICVPSIFFSIVGLFHSIKLPVELANGIQLSAAMIILVGVVIYYMVLSRTLAVGMLLFSLACLAGCIGIETVLGPDSTVKLWMICIGIFVAAWIVQFYGHEIEGAKPSFLKDLQFLMIGPAWLMSFIYKKLGVAL